MKHNKKLNFWVGLLFAFLPMSLAAQTLNITGRVTDETNAPVPGASILVKGTTQGTVTNVDGDYEITAASDATLVISFVGYGTREEQVAGRTVINVTLAESAESLDEVVVMGYGVQKKKLVTGATVQVSGEELQKLSTTTALAAMQSQTPGVNIIQSSGQPGEGFKVNIRGIGTLGSYGPLYVIDGVAGADINALNPSDIESIDVLKDAASAAIYGARAANGVILVTTKRGKIAEEGQTRPAHISYDGYYGVQNVWKMPSILNATQYMGVLDEISFNQGGSGYDWKKYLGDGVEHHDYWAKLQDGTWNGTNYLEEIRNPNAPIQNHAVNITGGGKNSTFALGFSYSDQEGIFGAPVESGYKRYTARVNSEHVIWRQGELDIIKFGETFNFMKSEKNGLGIGDQYWNDISNMLRAMPVIPAYNENGGLFDGNDIQAMGINNLNAWAANPIFGMINSRGYNLSTNYAINSSAYLLVQPIKGLTFRSQFGYRHSSWGYRSYSGVYFASTMDKRDVNSVSQSAGLGNQYTLDNTLNYVFKLGNNNFDVLVGQSIEKWGMGDNVESGNQGVKFDDFEHAYVDNTGAATASSTIGGSPWGQGALSSFFGRINYDYRNTYMLSVVMRADGSSNFARGHRWGTFPSVSGGWVLTNESFMQGVTSWMDFFKLRASWGRNGNSSITSFTYLATIASDGKSQYNFSNNPASVSSGSYPDKLPNPDVSWETSEQTDFGFDARFLKQRLGVNFDWYIKTTKDWLVLAPILAAYGTGAPYINGGDIRNRGMEIALNWRDDIGEFRYGANFNVSFNKNEVTRIANSEGIINGPSNVLSQATDLIYRAQVGYPIGYFYGFKTEGIFQNQADIDAWKAAGNGILQTAVQPGDVKFADVVHDGVIDEKDKTQIGDPNPHVRLNFGFNVGWKGIDLNVATYGAFGHQIARSYRKFGDSPFDNYTTEVYERWHGEGTSNKWPRLTEGNNPNYQRVSDIWFEDADYLRIQNITLGYDFKKLAPKMPFEQLRLYITAQNLWTFTKYKGMDPEVGTSLNNDDYGWASGIDVGYYPQPRTWLLGLNVTF